MRNHTICLILLALGLCTGSVWAANLITPGTGFVLTMDDLADLSASAGIDTVIKGSTPTPDLYADFFVRGRIIISPNDRLTIQPGERLIFRDQSSELFVQGQILALGQAVHDIVFTSIHDYNEDYGTGFLPFSFQIRYPLEDEEEEAAFQSILTSDMEIGTQILTITAAAAGSWSSASFSQLTGNSIFRYVTIRHASRGIDCSNIPEGRLTIEHCTIEYNHTGIYLASSSPLITDNRSISHHQLSFVGGSVVASSGTGIYMIGNSTPLIRRNTFAGNRNNAISIARGGAGMPLPRLGNLFNTENNMNIGMNNFVITYADPPFNTIRIGQRHIFHDTPNTIYAHQNYWGVTDPEEIDSIYIYDDDQNPASGPVLFQPFFTRTTDVEQDTWSDYR